MSHTKSTFGSVRLLLIVAVFTLGAVGWCPAGEPQPNDRQVELEKASLLRSRVEELFARGKFAEAEQPAEDAVKLYEKALGPDDAEVGRSVYFLAAVNKAQEKYPEADALLDRAQAILEKAKGAVHPTVAMCLADRADAQTALGNHDKANEFFARADDIFAKTIGEDDPGAVANLQHWIIACRAQRKPDAAERLCRKILAVQDKSPTPDDSARWFALVELGNACTDQKKYDEAEPAYKRAITIVEARDPKHIFVATTLESLANMYSLAGREADAVAARHRAAPIFAADEAAREIEDLILPLE
ncbi:MAG TPA: tetratricopeptide repeat protein [Pirellulales bacterium]|jgi:tetratricopeptide (TPR) repeat protein